MRPGILYILTILNVLLIAGGGIWVKTYTPKTAYINMAKVFDEFELAKEYNKKITDYQNKTKSILDSLGLQVNYIAKKLNNERNEKDEELFELKKEEYFAKKQQFEDGYQMQTEQYSSEAMKQLNQYVSDYGKENNYSYIYGADGNGTLMYANEQEDITEEIIEYINEKYRGVK